MKFKTILAVLALGVISVSCSSDEPGADGNSYGTIEPNFAADYDVSFSRAQAESASAPAVIQPEIGDFAVKLTKDDGSVSKTWSKVSEMSTSETFPVGDYTISASYGDIANEGFDMPYYYGDAEFTIYDGDVATPSVTATLQNSMVSIDYTESFIKYFTDYSTTIQSVTGTYITFAKDEVRAAYVKPGDVKITMELTNTEGKTVTVMPASITDVKARYHYHVTFDVNNGENGEALLVITFNDELADGGEVEITLGDELFNAEVPSLSALDFTPGTSISNVQGDEPDNRPRMAASAMAGFGEVILTTESTELINDGWPSEIDLKNIDADKKAYLLNKGLKVTGLWGTVASNMALIDFSGVMPNLPAGTSGATHKFTIVVKDILTRVTDPITLEISTTPLTLALPSTTTTVVGTGVAEATLTCNGKNVSDNVSLQVLKANGSWEECTILSITETSTGQYTVRFNVPISASAQQVRAVHNTLGTQSNEMTVNPTSPELTITADETDTWATKATLSLSTTTSGVDATTIAKIASVYLSTDDGSTYTKHTSFTVSGTSLNLTGLTAGTAYKMKVSVVNSDSSASNALDVTTESATQLPNSDMESWSKTQVGYYGNALSRTYYYQYFPYASGETDIWWATNNDRTLDGITALGIRSSTTSACAVSYRSDIKHGGSYSAQIYSSGHSGGYASTGTIIYEEGAVAGTLFVGSYNWSSSTETRTTGHSFSSRPSSFSFWYRYIPKNSDQFHAVIEVRSGDTVIASYDYVPEAISSDSGSFQQVTLPLTYTNTKLKATSIYVSFWSSTKTSFSESDFNRNSSLKTGDESISVHYGSILYIDDLSLNY